jgi:hypothetical protein
VLPPEIRQRPEKLDTIPEAPLLVASQRDALRDRLAQLRGHRAAALFDVEEIARRIARLPAIDRLDAPFAFAPELQRETGALRRVFLALEFVAQHH